MTNENTNPSTQKPLVTIYSDGGANPNPGAGGWGVVILSDGKKRELSGAEPDTTNNRMELTAACEALESLKTASDVVFYTDSTYVKNGISSWIHGWRRKGWIGSTNKPIANVDLWKRLDAATHRHDIEWRWVKGHSGNEYNERVDQLATAARNKMLGIGGDDLPDGERAEAKPASVTPTPQGTAVYLATANRSELEPVRWGAVIVEDGERREVSAPADGNTENQAVLEAAAQVLNSFPAGQSLDIYTDSEYLQKGITSWIQGWIKKGWKTASGSPVKNREQWEALHAAAQKHNIRWHTIQAGSSAHFDQARRLVK